MIVKTLLIRPDAVELTRHLKYTNNELMTRPNGQEDYNIIFYFYGTPCNLIAKNNDNYLTS